jgi:polysaccharide export outer membrane protein
MGWKFWNSRTLIVCISLYFISLMFTPSLSAQTLQQGTRPNTPAVYTIQPGDVLEIYVSNEPNISRRGVLVRPDGRISIPFVQDLLAASLTPGELKLKIEDNIRPFMAVPAATSVWVIVEAIKSYKVFVTGKVGRSGEIISEKPLTFVQAIALAGGYAQFANLDEMVVIRGVGEDQQVIKINYNLVSKGQANNQNIVLRSGDTILVN